MNVADQYSHKLSRTPETSAGAKERLIASGMFLWVIYGFIRSDPVIIGTNAAGFALNVTLLVMKLRYDKMQEAVF
jgi:uncharacterized protein with PQ loop repeat